MHEPYELPGDHPFVTYVNHDDGTSPCPACGAVWTDDLPIRHNAKGLKVSGATMNHTETCAFMAWKNTQELYWQKIEAQS